jgi:DNA polymerase III delta subunit
MPSPAGKKRANTAAPASDAAATAGAERVVLLVGPEPGRKWAEAEALLARHAAGDWADFDSEILDGGGDAATADRVLAGVATAPLGGPEGGRRVVVVRDTQQMDADEQKRLAAGLGRIPASGLLILHTGAPVIEDGKTKRGSVIVAELTAAVKKSGGRVIEFGLPKTDDLRAWLAAGAKTLGKTLAADALALLAQLPGEDLPRAETELAKAAAHAGDSPTISLLDVEATLSRGAGRRDL